MTYAEKLKDPRWQKKRLYILSRDNWTCCYCQDKETTLHVHHDYYEPNKAPWEADDESLLTLCEDCHEIQHLLTTELERTLFCALKNRMVMYNEDIKVLNRVIKEVILHG